MTYKNIQDRIDNNSVTDLEMDRAAMCEFLKSLTRDQLENFKDLCEKLIDHKPVSYTHLTLPTKA